MKAVSVLPTLETPGAIRQSQTQHPSVEHYPASLEYLAEIGFGVEYGESAPVLHKWTDDLRIKVYGTLTSADTETLGQIIAELNGLLAKVHLQLADTNANVEIYFLPEPQFASVEPEYVPVNLGFFRVWWDGAGAIQRANILIASQGLTQQERSHLIREELTQSLGLFRDSWQHPDSVFYQGWTSTTSYSDLDRATISLLYSPQLQSGMTQAEVLKTLRSPSTAP